MAKSNRPDLQTARGAPPEGVNLADNFGDPNAPERSNRRAPRAEMKGPSDISDILSRMKTKTVNLESGGSGAGNDESSTISIQELKEMSDKKLPKPTVRGRKPKSERNTVALDL